MDTQPKTRPPGFVGARPFSNPTKARDFARKWRRGKLRVRTFKRYVQAGGITVPVWVVVIRERQTQGGAP